MRTDEDGCTYCDKHGLSEKFLTERHAQRAAFAATLSADELEEMGGAALIADADAADAALIAAGTFSLSL
jgi:hypothetical protein